MILGIFGYIILILTLILFVGLLIFGVFCVVRIPKLGIALIVLSGAALFGVCRALWVRTSEPDGIPVSASDAPGLFAMIDEVALAAGGLRIDGVVLTPYLNAAAQATPRFGVFGWYRTHLIVGLPLLHSLSEDEFKAVLAHEFGHFGKHHGSITNWVYRTGRTWESMATSISGDNLAGVWLRPFIRWFWPRFHATAFVLSRRQEYEADAFAARITSAESAALALARIALVRRRFEGEFLPSVKAGIRRSAEPPDSVWEMLLSHLASEPPSDSHGLWLKQEFASLTDTSDTHPGLRDRYAALGVSPPDRLPVSLGAKAALLLSPDFEKDARSGFDKAWKEQVLSEWKADWQAVAALPSIDDTSVPVEAQVAALWKHIVVLHDIEGGGAVQPLVDRLLALDPDHVGAKCVRGEWLSEKDDAAAVPLLEAGAVHPDYALRAIAVLNTFYDRRGDHEAILRLKRLADSNDARRDAAIRELRELNAKMIVEPPALRKEDCASIREILSRFPQIKRARLVRRRLKAWPEQQVHVLALDIRFPWYRPTSESSYVKIVENVVEALGETEGVIQVIRKHGYMKAAYRHVVKKSSDVFYDRAFLPPPLPKSAPGDSR